MSKSKFWCFTENTSAAQFKGNLEFNWDVYRDAGVTYICGQLETASTGQLHFQGYLQLKASRAMSFVRNTVSSTAHWEIQKGTSDQARDYCHKEDQTAIADSFVEFGTYAIAGRPGPGSRPGTRTDIHELRDAIKNGATQRELIEDDDKVETFAKYLKFADRVRTLYPPKRKSEADFKVILFVGEPGSGKTRRAMELYPDLFEVPISNGTLWLDGYDSHTEVLFDDFMGAASKMSLDNTLKFLDRYIRKVPVKGAHAWYSPDTVIVTSNYHPRAWYSWNGREESWKALCRRFHEIWSFRADQEPVQEDSEQYLSDRELWPPIDQGQLYLADGSRDTTNK